VTAGDQQVQHTEREREVGAGDRLEHDVGAVGGRGAARVDHDDLPAVLADAVEVAGRRRHRLGEVGADEDDDVGVLDVGQREGQPPVHPERAGGGGGGRAHAPAAVVVDLAGAERDPGELPELVGLLVGEAAAAEHGHAVGAVLGLDLTDPAGDQVEGLVPGGARPLPRGPVADQRGGQPLPVPEEPGRGPALAAQRPFVDRELRPRLHRRRPATHEGHAALQRAVGAVGPGPLPGAWRHRGEGERCAVTHAPAAANRDPRRR
jgi:hypothetical protein